MIRHSNRERDLNESVFSFPSSSTPQQFWRLVGLLERLVEGNMEMNKEDAQIIVTSLYFRMLDMFRTL